MNKVGKVTVKTHRNRVIVFLDGIDVSRDAYEADDIEGYVKVYIRDSDGRIKVVNHQPQSETKTGNVVIQLKENK